MAGIGDLLLNLRGLQNPRAAMVGQLLGRGTGGAGAAPGTGAPATPAPGQGVATPPQPQAYQSPPDLLDLYTQLSDYESRSRRIDTGLGLLGSAFAQPDNRANVINAMAGGGGMGSAPDALSLVQSIAEMQQAAAEKERAEQEDARRRSALPAIAAQMNIPIEQVVAMYEQGALDSVLIDRAKPDTPEGTKLITDPATGRQMLVGDRSGNTVREFDTGLSPKDTAEAVKRRVITDPDTGRQWLVNDVDGSVIREYQTGIDPTVDQKQYRQAVEQGYEGTLEQWLTDDANRKRQPAVQINNNLGANVDRSLVEGGDKLLLEDQAKAKSAVTNIAALNHAQTVLTRPGGIIAGSIFSPAEYESRKLVADLFGIEDPAVINSATYSSVLGDAVLAKVKELGTGNSISNADREFTEKNMGASNQIPAEAMPRILAINEFGSRNEIIKYNESVDRRLDAARDENGNVDPRVAASLQKIPVPTISDHWMAFVDPADLQVIREELQQNGELSEQTKRSFDIPYGPHAADAVVERIRNGY